MDILQTYDNYWNEGADPRTNDWVLIHSAGYLTLTILLYLYLVLVLGPRYMKDKKPYSLKTYIKCYDLFQIIINAYIAQQFLGCTTIESMFYHFDKDSISEEDLYRVASTIWLLTVLKLIDLSETVVFILRKKHRQISFLHLYHHVSILLLVWYAAKYYPYAPAAFSMLTNCIVHVIMYTYYLISALGETLQKLINPLKPFITILQMVQFVIIIIQYVSTTAMGITELKLAIIGITNILINLTLFSNFYRKSYVKSAQKKS